MPRSPVIRLLKTQRSLGTAIVLVRVDVEDILPRPRKSSFADGQQQGLKSVRLIWGGKSIANGIQEAYRARRDCCSPVPLITTSHCVSERDSMVWRMGGRRVMEKKVEAFCFADRIEGFCMPGS